MSIPLNSISLGLEKSMPRPLLRFNHNHNLNNTDAIDNEEKLREAFDFLKMLMYDTAITDGIWYVNFEKTRKGINSCFVVKRRGGERSLFHPNEAVIFKVELDTIRGHSKVGYYLGKDAGAGYRIEEDFISITDMKEPLKFEILKIEFDSFLRVVWKWVLEWDKEHAEAEFSRTKIGEDIPYWVTWRVISHLQDRNTIELGGEQVERNVFNEFADSYGVKAVKESARSLSFQFNE